MGATREPASGAGRFESWRAGWRVALRMARRDVRRHRGRSILIVVMVGLPVLLLTAGSTLWFTNDLDTAERLPFQLGQTQAFVMAPQEFQVRQYVDPSAQDGWQDEPPAALPLPGAHGAGVEMALETLLDADLYSVTSGPATAEVDGRFSTVVVLGADMSRPERLAPRVSLDSGRWPRSPEEVVVTVQGREHGLPDSGTITLALEKGAGQREHRSVTVVGTGRAFDAQGGEYLQQPDVVSATEPHEVTTTRPGDYVSRQWLVDRSAPLTWAEIEELNTYGVLAYSRHVALHPETATRQVEWGEQEDLVLLVVAAASLGLFMLTTLLAGPAFAVSAARQRRTLALAASNGATSAQLRRSVLGQALVLGVLSSLVGTGLGIAGGLGATTVIRAARPDLLFGPLDIPWPAVTLIAAAAVVSSVVAALIPSRGLARLDLVSVLRGQSVSPRLRRRVPLTGAILTAAGAAVVTWTSFSRVPMVYLVFLGGCVLLVIGSLMLVPLALAVVARFAHRLPLPVRMAAREAGRQRGRATPTVAAIMAGAAVLAVVAIGLEADTERRARDHIETVLPGQGIVQGAMMLPDARVADTLQRVDPTVSTVTLQRLSDFNPSTPGTLLTAQRPGCSVRDTVMPIEYPPDGAPDQRCLTLASEGALIGSSLAAAPLGELDRFLDLSPAQQAALERGAIAIVDPTQVAHLPKQSISAGPPRTIDRHRPVDVDVDDGTVTFASYPDHRDAQDMPRLPAESDITYVELPVVLLSHDQWSRLVTGWAGGPGGLVTTETATRLGATLQLQSILVRAPSGVSPELETRLKDTLASTEADTMLEVERGFQRDDTLALAIAFGAIGLIILVATLIATALTQAENTPLLGTLAAVGATKRTRRALAGAQALYLGLLGAVIGVTVGLVPGAAIARLVTTTYREDGTPVLPDSIDIPWLQVLIPLLAVPLVAGALAWVSIRRAPIVTRRTT